MDLTPVHPESCSNYPLSVTVNYFILANAGSSFVFRGHSEGEQDLEYMEWQQFCVDIRRLQRGNCYELHLRQRQGQ